jgi:hypothetical protein
VDKMHKSLIGVVADADGGGASDVDRVLPAVGVVVWTRNKTGALMLRFVAAKDWPSPKDGRPPFMG